MVVIIIKNKAHFQGILKENEGKVIAVDFSAEWCGPCKAIGPKFKELSDKHNIIFVKVDVDDNDEIAQEFGISAMPTFKFIKSTGGGKWEVLDELCGASSEQLTALCDKHK